jgi:aminoglycoside/choline kinase family phosphotransferase
MHEQIVRLYEQHFGSRPKAILEVQAHGSARSYYRLVGDEWQTAIGAINADRDENRAFIGFTGAFRSVGLPVPEIYGEDEEAGVWLEEDLGDTTLFDALVQARRLEGADFPASVLEIYKRVVEMLPRFQVEGGQAVDYTLAYPRAAFDLQSILWDLNYFKYHFLKLAHIPFREAHLEEDFKRLARFLLLADTRHFLYRDFQSRNVMLRDGQPWFIDYQGGRQGALQYDIASLLYDAKADIPEATREILLEHYLDALQTYFPVDRELFRQQYRGYVLVRIMQAMGAYGYRGFFERKPRFLQSVPYAARNIDRILEEGLPVKLPELMKAFRQIVKKWAPASAPVRQASGLTVVIGSFSYRRGYPEDESGHGGGFVFDCRALPNPGRHLEYASQCGRDAPVAVYIEQCPEAVSFWQNVLGLAEVQVAEYLRRGFSDLSIWFGCTGGQHRSVYMAERLAKHLQDHFPTVNVVIKHREESHWPDRDSAVTAA